MHYVYLSMVTKKESEKRQYANKLLLEYMCIVLYILLFGIISFASNFFWHLKNCEQLAKPQNWKKIINTHKSNRTVKEMRPNNNIYSTIHIYSSNNLFAYCLISDSFFVTIDKVYIIHILAKSIKCLPALLKKLPKFIYHLKKTKKTISFISIERTAICC